jgi:hypothetical protein
LIGLLQGWQTAGAQNIGDRIDTERVRLRSCKFFVI